jgi:hypothetical protein
MLNGEERCRRGRVGLSRGDWLTPPPPLTLGEPGVEPHQERARAGMARGGATGAGGGDFTLLGARFGFERSVRHWKFATPNFLTCVLLHGTRYMTMQIIALGPSTH